MRTGAAGDAGEAGGEVGRRRRGGGGGAVVGEARGRAGMVS